MSEASAPAYPIESVDRALTVILAFQETDSMSIAEIGRLLNVSRSTAYRLLTLLEHRQFVRQDQRTKRFHAGPALLRVGLAAVRRSDVRVALRPLLERIVEDVDETAHVVVLQEGEAMFMDCVEGSHMIRATPRVGTSMPAHVTASGKVLLANLSDETLDQLLGGDLRALTPRSKTSARAIKREIAKFRAQGWATNDGESEVGLRAVACLVDHSASNAGLDAAITVAGPASRLSDERLRHIAETMLARIGEFGRNPRPD